MATSLFGTGPGHREKWPPYLSFALVLPPYQVLQKLAPLLYMTRHTRNLIYLCNLEAGAQWR